MSKKEWLGIVSPSINQYIYTQITLLYNSNQWIGTMQSIPQIQRGIMFQTEALLYCDAIQSCVPLAGVGDYRHRRSRFNRVLTHVTEEENKNPWNGRKNETPELRHWMRRSKTSSGAFSGKLSSVLLELVFLMQCQTRFLNGVFLC